MNTSHKQVEKLANDLLLLERNGKHEEALSKLRDIWEDRTKTPNVEDYKPKLAAEIILRCGSLIGFLGHNKQFPNSQERSKNLLTEARNRFLDIYEVEKVAECENYLALAYWRTGEISEAETWVEESLSHKVSESEYVRLYAHLTKSLINLSFKKYKEIIIDLKTVEEKFKKHGDDFLKGSFYINLGAAFLELNELSIALEHYKLAKYSLQKSNYEDYLGLVENNLAQIYKLDNKCSKAHQAIDNATLIFKKLNDRTRIGFSFDTKAQIYFVEGKLKEALECSATAIKILKQSENVAYLVEAYHTKIKTLVLMSEILEASNCLADAIWLAKTHIGEDASKRVVKEYVAVINERIAPVITNAFGEKQIVVKGFSKEVYEEVFDEDYDENSELVLPLELRKYRKLDGVKMSNNNLKEIGIYEGSLAIIAEEEEIVNGDLIVILELENQSVHCGYYSADFDFISLEKPDTEVQLFSENEITILGKIVGVGDSKDEQGRLIIRPI